MKSLVSILLFIVMSIMGLANDDIYGVRTSLHTNNIDKIQSELKEAEKSVKTFENELHKVVQFMESYTALSTQHEFEAQKFAHYVKSHQKAVARCKLSKLKLEKEIQNGSISQSSIVLEENRIERCRNRAKRLTVTYKNATNFFNNSLAQLKKIKEKYKTAGNEHAEIVEALDAARSSYEFLSSLK